MGTKELFRLNRGGGSQDEIAEVEKLISNN
jgi:hypothetical protein